jgi:hypothetical protein
VIIVKITYGREKVMSFAPKQFRALIQDTLNMFGQKANSSSFNSDSAVELLMLTAAQETHLGKYLKQVKGPALGVYQMEPNTYNDIWANYICYRQNLLDALNALYASSDLEWRLRMRGDLVYQTIMSRIFYMRVPEALPSVDEPMGLAYYWKKYYNTKYGKGTPEEAYKNYNKYCFK